MAIINQSPTGQPSVTLDGIDFNNIGFSGTNPIWQSKKLVGSPSVEISFCPGGSGPSVPTVGQIFPLFG